MRPLPTDALFCCKLSEINNVLFCKTNDFRGGRNLIFNWNFHVKYAFDLCVKNTHPKWFRWVKEWARVSISSRNSSMQYNNCKFYYIHAMVMKHMDALTSGLFTVQIHLNDLIETEIALKKRQKQCADVRCFDICIKRIGQARIVSYRIIHTK